MTLEGLLESLQVLPASARTAYIVVKTDARPDGVFVDSVAYLDGEVVLTINPDTLVRDDRRLPW